MTKTRLFVAALLISASATGVNAQSADFDWTGAYAGGTASFGVFNSETSDHWCYVACDGGSLTEAAGALGVAIGYNKQIGSLVVGVVADYMAGNFETEHIVSQPGVYSSYTSSSWENIFTLRGRAGIAADRSLIYVTGGLASVEVNHRQDYNFGPDAQNTGYRPYEGRETGFAAGVGVEHAISDKVTLGAEYQYIGLPSVDGGPYFRNLDDDNNFDVDSSVEYRSSAHLFRLGVNWRF